ncbi:glycine cleavage system aminomethyltransferase GcvT [Aneurinibacillus sp. REN35]|uniref:glycine cleavage system aminomethyltransferase GcvT n=1 Tax=Aneurinibacillus sp. REN35 TaxID=3237286 RepID=UPI0035299C33
MQTHTVKQTSLFPLYAKYGGKTIDFGGWELPVQFTSIIEEHQAVRTRAGLFDVSHMGEIIIKGKNAASFIQSLITNNIHLIEKNQALYAAMCYPHGGTVDDLLVYKMEENEYMLVVNASNISKDFVWMLDQRKDPDLIIKNISDQVALLALQGPKAEKVLQMLTAFDLSEIKPFRFYKDVELGGGKVLVSRTGYTGEDGFELYLPAAEAPALWEEILTVGEAEGVVPCGLGARDTLRFEARLPLYGQELGEDISPLEASIGFAVKLDQDDDFIGKEALRKQKENGVPRKLVGLEMVGRGIPRSGYLVYPADSDQASEPIGHVTSGTQSPTLKKNLGLALLQSDEAVIDQEVDVEIRGKRIKAKIVKTPFYKR